MNDEFALFLRTLMALNSVTLWLAGRREGYASALVASLLLLAGALGWSGAWSATVLAGYWGAVAGSIFWLFRDGLRQMRRGRG